MALGDSGKTSESVYTVLDTITEASQGEPRWWRVVCYAALLVYRLVIFLSCLVWLLAVFGMWYLTFGGGIVIHH